MNLRILYFIGLFLLLSISVSAVEPDISAIGDFRAYSGNFKNLDGEETDQNGNLNYQFNSMELALNGNLNPYTRADFYVANHAGEFEIEEAYLTFLRGLPLKAQLRAGKFLVDFGRLNIQHPHVYSFMDRPLMHRVYFGYDGFNDMGVNVNFMLPTSFYSQLSLNVLAGDLFEGHSHGHGEVVEGEEEEHEHGFPEERATEDPIYSSRLNFFLPIGEKGNLDFGFSGLYGAHHYNAEEDEKLYTTMGAFDIKYKLKFSDYNSLTIMGEFMLNKRDALVEDEILMEHYKTDFSNYGYWASIDYQFNKRYNIGFKFERSPGIFDAMEDNDYGYIIDEEENNTPIARYDEDNYTNSFTFFTGFMLMEETTLIRLAVNYNKYNVENEEFLRNSMRVENDNEMSVAVQVVWSLGPHKPHNF